MTPRCECWEASEARTNRCEICGTLIAPAKPWTLDDVIMKPTQAVDALRRHQRMEHRETYAP